MTENHRKKPGRTQQGCLASAGAHRRASAATGRRSCSIPSEETLPLACARPCNQALRYSACSRYTCSRSAQLKHLTWRALCVELGDCTYPGQTLNPSEKAAEYWAQCHSPKSIRCTLCGQPPNLGCMSALSTMRYSEIFSKTLESTAAESSFRKLVTYMYT